MNKIDIDGLTESEAFMLYFRLRNKFGWCGSPTSMGDVPVYQQGDYEDGEEPYWDGDGMEMTPAMRGAVLDTYAWRKGIDERTSEVANEMVPKIEVLDDGGFLLHSDSSPSVRYSAKGEELA
jgi:hypothetical protein